MKLHMVLSIGCFTLAYGLSTSIVDTSVNAEEAGQAKSVVMIAGNPSHGYGSHEHYAGCRLIADVLHKGTKNIKCQVIQNGWPADDSILDQADTIVIYADGGAKHPALAHMDRLQKQLDCGAGFVCLHYAVEVPPGDAGNKFKDWLGGYFEIDWSVNPHWTAEFTKLPDHPASRGVQPFAALDEWYFHMRFQEGMKGVTPILSAVPPASTMSRPDGHHSGNPAVRKEVAAGMPQHVAWAYQRPNGGRSFGFTGGHFHWNWGNPDMQRVVGNAIVWTAKGDVPSDGIACGPLGLDRLKENQDESVPTKFSEEDIKKEFKLTAK